MTFLNSGPSSIEGFDGSVLAELRVTKPSTKVYRSDYKVKIIPVRHRSVQLKTLFNISYEPALAANLMLPSPVGTGTLEH